MTIRTKWPPVSSQEIFAEKIIIISLKISIYMDIEVVIFQLGEKYDLLSNSLNPLSSIFIVHIWNGISWPLCGLNDDINVYIPYDIAFCSWCWETFYVNELIKAQSSRATAWKDDSPWVIAPKGYAPRTAPDRRKWQLSSLKWGDDIIESRRHHQAPRVQTTKQEVPRRVNHILEFI